MALNILFLLVLTRAPLGVLDYHALLGLFEHPLLTGLPGHVAIRERRRLKERQNRNKSLWYFFGQIKGQVTRGQ